MRKPSLTDRVRYAFDNTMSRGPIALIGYLAVLSAVIILAVSLFVLATGVAPADEGGERPGLLGLVWAGLMRTLDAGTMGGDQGSWPFLLAMLAVTLGGVFVVSTLIGILSSAIEAKLDDLRKGRSLVIEENHTVILGWSEQVMPILSELALANANQKHPCVAILADKDKVEMEDEIKAKLGRAGKMRIVCRTGSPMDAVDLAIVNPEASRSIIVVSPETDSPDAQVIKVLLALTNSPRRRPTPYHIVAEVRDPDNVSVARMVGKDEVVIVQAGYLIPRIMAQTCRQSGLSVVYTELLDFGGDEIYMQEEPALVGKTFAEAMMAYEDSTVIGMVARDGTTILKPDFERDLVAWDKLIAISADDDTVKLSGLADPPVDEASIAKPKKRKSTPERTLILGWNSRAAAIIRELDAYVAAGSRVTVVADSATEANIAMHTGGLRRQECTVQQANTTDRRVLDGLNISQYGHVIVLSYSDTLGVQEADAKTLITLLHLRDIADKSATPFSIVSEMMDIHNRELAEVTRADDFVVSNRLVSLLIAQVSENKGLGPVFDDLFDPEGVEIYLKPADDYVLAGAPVNFYTVTEAARRRGEIALGYRLHAEANEAAKSYGVHVNPKKSARVVFGADDRVIVLAES
jgi:voltage-gated potassium channel Kch